MNSNTVTSEPIPVFTVAVPQHGSMSDASPEQFGQSTTSNDQVLSTQLEDDPPPRYSSLTFPSAPPI